MEEKASKLLIWMDNGKTLQVQNEEVLSFTKEELTNKVLKLLEEKALVYYPMIEKASEKEEEKLVNHIVNFAKVSNVAVL